MKLPPPQLIRRLCFALAILPGLIIMIRANVHHWHHGWFRMYPSLSEPQQWELDPETGIDYFSDPKLRLITPGRLLMASHWNAYYAYNNYRTQFSDTSLAPDGYCVCSPDALEDLGAERPHYPDYADFQKLFQAKAWTEARLVLSLVGDELQHWVIAHNGDGNWRIEHRIYGQCNDWGFTPDILNMPRPHAPSKIHRTDFHLVFTGIFSKGEAEYLTQLLKHHFDKTTMLLTPAHENNQYIIRILNTKDIDRSYEIHRLDDGQYKVFQVEEFMGNKKLIPVPIRQAEN